MRLVLILSTINFSNTFFYTIPFLIVLSILVFIHEFGHYLIAKLCGVKIEEFSIGFGKSIASIKDKSGTMWKFSILPFGGYVKMFGDQSPASAPDAKKLSIITDDEKKIAFFYKKPWIKLLIVLAGPVMNFVLAIVLITGLFYFHGYTTTSNIISFIEQGSPAEKAGLIKGDKIIALNKKNMKNMNDIRNYIIFNVGERLNMNEMVRLQKLKQRQLLL
ncbi:regulator of sigma E protease [Candidatus Xenohaliotis californiensis]|uniref:Regulator of sigma E protease n=1 Tax=Candidatus Xenohaliotis californiensis TaxID=84677 RepID=A0ABP0EST1_9RICK|nr:regulator of sigma E protease [Candidatus Xenohaliotis californiensis]